MKRSFCVWVLVALVLFTGCVKKMTLKDTFTAPRVEGEPEQISYYRFALSEFLDVTDTALLFDKGVSEPSLSWKAVIFQKTATPGKYNRIELFATRDIFEPRTFLGIKVPDTIQIGDDDRMVILDHAEKLIFNATGKFMEADYKSVDPVKYDDFFTKISDLKKVVYEKGSPEYDKLIEFSKNLHGVELVRAAKAVRKKLGVPFGATLTEEQLQRVKEKGWDKLFQSLLYDNWSILLGYGISAEEAGAHIIVNKIFMVPAYWFRDENGPGRMRRAMTAADTYFMMKWWQGRGMPAAREKKAAEQLLSEEFKASLKGGPCENAETYAAYSQCVAEYNQEVKRYNEKISDE